ncbi:MULTISPECIES: hypothetical protein [unclassified Pseudoalteromonas]|uniref:hypothetical protein n=1 Tax=unclassified Pseudoalteromonas TaxID=194690 RepID=UPI0019D213F3|nr:hypothetical protein [Pseudoalteromonas sp. JC3]MBR8843419.1 hypothetical protein [Pseudoalteromonas sp. JC3]WJE11362.1 hypothetical protein QSH61_19755 [Pseudoalteromonas sp. JC3]
MREIYGDFYAHEYLFGRRAKDISGNILLVVGPSGSGKSSISSILNKMPQYEIIRNYTTRYKRSDDRSGHFSYISEDRYESMIKNNDFMLFCEKERGMYGYLVEDIFRVINKGSIGILMFRNTGAKALLDLHSHIKTVFITANPADSAKHSREEKNKPSTSKNRDVLLKNQELFDKAEKKLVIENTFSGVSEMFTICNSIHEFVNNDM